MLGFAPEAEQNWNRLLDQLKLLNNIELTSKLDSV